MNVKTKSYGKRSPIKLLAMSIAVLALSLAATLGADASRTGPSTHGSAITLRYGVANGPTALGNVDMLQTIMKKTKGRLNIQPFYSGALGNEATMITQVENGSLDMALISDGAMAAIEPAVNITELPFFWKSQKALDTVMINGPIGKYLLNLLASKSLKGLGIALLGPRTVLSSKPINSVSDVAGLKIRVVPSALFTAEWTRWGANPVPVAVTEVFTALQTGTVGAVDSNATGMASLNWYQAAHYLAETNHEWTVSYLIMNMKRWNKLPKATQTLLLSAVQAGQQANQAGAAAGNDAAIQQMVNGGVTVTHPDTTSMLPGAKLVWNDFVGQIGQQLFNQALRLQGKVK